MKYCSPECKKTGEIKECSICKKEYYVCKSEVERNKYCSAHCQKIGISKQRKGKCYYRPPKNGRYKPCKICGKEIYVTPSQERRAKYCSITCMYKGISGKRDKNNNTYLKDFRIMRKAILKNIKECSLCHQEKPLAIHHIDYDKENNSIKNLIPLCLSCHSKTNFKRQECKEFLEIGTEGIWVL